MCWDESYLSHLWNRTMILTLNSSIAWMWLLSQALGEVKLNLGYWLLRPIFQILSWAKPTNILFWLNHQNISTTIHEFKSNLSKYFIQILYCILTQPRGQFKDIIKYPVIMETLFEISLKYATCDIWHIKKWETF